MKQITTIAIVTLLSVALYAQKPITGAFGYKFGESLPKEKIQHDLGDHCYVVQPSKKFRVFNMYCVNVTPITGKIYAVMLGYRTEAKDGEKEYRAALAVLENVYGKFKKVVDRPLRIHYMYASGKQSIAVNYGRPNFDLEAITIIYVDQDLYNQAQEEKKKLQIKQTDASML